MPSKLGSNWFLPSVLLHGDHIFILPTFCTSITVQKMTHDLAYFPIVTRKNIGYIYNDKYRKQHISYSVSVGVFNIIQNGYIFLLNRRGQSLLSLAYHLAIVANPRLKFHGLEFFCFDLNRIQS